MSVVPSPRYLHPPLLRIMGNRWVSVQAHNDFPADQFHATLHPCPYPYPYPS